VHLRVGHAVDDAQDLARRQVQIAVDLRRVVLEGVFERLPIHGHLADGARRAPSTVGCSPDVVAGHGSLPPKLAESAGRADRPLLMVLYPPVLAWAEAEAGFDCERKAYL
jgi:hypothetical protein